MCELFCWCVGVRTIYDIIIVCVFIYMAKHIQENVVNEVIVLIKSFHIHVCCLADCLLSSVREKFFLRILRKQKV